MPEDLIVKRYEASKKLRKRIIKGDNFFMLSEEYIEDLKKLPKDVLINMLLKYKKEALEFRIKYENCEKSFDGYASTFRNI